MGYGTQIPVSAPADELLVISLQDETTVSFLFGEKTTRIYHYVTNQPHDWMNITLKKYQTFQLQANKLAGTYIVSNMQVAVFSGGRVQQVGTFGAKGHLCSQLIPISKWEKTFILSPSPDRNADIGDTFQFITSENNTNITIIQRSGGAVISTETITVREKRQVIERTYDSFAYSSVLADKPITVYTWRE